MGASRGWRINEWRQPGRVRCKAAICVVIELGIAPICQAVESGQRSFHGGGGRQVAGEGFCTDCIVVPLSICNLVVTPSGKMNGTESLGIL